MPGAQVTERQAIRGGEVRAFDRRIDFVLCDVDQAIVFRAGGCAFLIFLFTMESGPEATVSFTVAQQRDFFGSSARYTEWFE